MTPVKNHGSCGSCWCLLNNGCSRGRVGSQHGPLCCFKTAVGGLRRCGSILDDGWAHKQCFCLRRIEPHLHQERYSYVGTQGTCLASSCTVGFAQGIDTGLTEVTTKNAQALKDALAQLPVSIAIGNDSMYLCSHGAMRWCVQLYSGDVLHFWCGTSPDHGRHHGLLEGQESLETHVD